jgi:hypothetical protein
MKTSSNSESSFSPVFREVFWYGGDFGVVGALEIDYDVGMGLNYEFSVREDLPLLLEFLSNNVRDPNATLESQSCCH